VDLLGNRIVLVAPIDREGPQIVIAQGFDLAGSLGAEGRLAMGDPDHVPAGRYGKAALDTLGAWKGVAHRLARAQTVRAALAMIARGETPLGIVYATDAAISDKVKVVGVFPPQSHPPITYPIAVVAGRQTPVVQRYFAFLQSAPARVIFEKAGFTVHW
jgi:molybdate transport system substrate-binding protein